MSQFDGGNRPVGPMGNGGVLPELYNTVLPNAPGLEAAPLVESDTQKAIRQGLDAAGYAASITSTLGNLNQQQIREQERQRREQEAALEKQRNAIAQADRGLASRQTQTDLAEIQRKIAAGELAPTEGESIEDFANRVLGMDGPAASEYSPEYTAQRLAIGQPAIANAVSNRREGVIRQARADQQVLILAGGETATAADVPDVAAGLRQNDPSIPEAIAMRMATAKAITGAAASGDVARFDELSATFKDTLDPVTLAEAKSTLDQQIERKRVDLETQAMNDIARLENSGVPASDLRGIVEADQRLDEVSRSRVLTAIDGRQKQALTNVQQDGANNLTRDVRLGRWTGGTPASTVSEIVRRMDLPSTDPAFISAVNGTELIQGVEKRMDFDVRTELMRTQASVMNTTGRSIVPATPADDSAMVRVMKDSGLVSGIADGEKTVVTGVSDPVGAAKMMVTLGRVPTPIAQIIASGAGSADVDQVTDAMTMYASIYAQNPLKAESIEMPEDAKLRARYIATRIEDANLKNADSNAVRAMVARLVPTAMSMKVGAEKIDDHVIQGVVYGIDSKAKDFAPKVQSSAQSAIIKQINDPAIAQYLGITQSRFNLNQGMIDAVTGPNRTAAFASGAANPSMFLGSFFAGDGPTANIAAVPPYVVNTYNDAVTEEFRFAKSMGLPDDAASKQATQFAMRRAMSKHTPSAWGNHLTFSLESEAPYNADALRSEAVQAMGKSAADELWQLYQPKYDDKIGGRPGYVFIRNNDPTAMFKSPSGGRLKLTGNPDAKPAPSMRELVLAAQAEQKAKGTINPLNAAAAAITTTIDSALR